MDSHTCANILGTLEGDDIWRVILVGEAGSGKTWMARQICERATSEGSCYISLWLNLNKDLDEFTLYEDIASQLSVFLDKEEDDSDEDGIEDVEDQKVRDVMILKDKIDTKLWKKKRKCRGKKYLLLVLDDEGFVTTETKAQKDLHLRDFLAPHQPVKIIVTRRKEVVAIDGNMDIQSYARDESHAYSDGEIQSYAGDESHAYSDGEIQSYAGDESHAYSDEEIQSHAMSESHLNSQTIDGSLTFTLLFTDDYLEDLIASLITDESRAKLDNIRCSWGVLRQHIVRMSMRLPAALVVLVKSLNSICQDRSFLSSPNLQKVLEKVIPLSCQSDTAIGCDGATGRSRKNPILQLCYDLFQTDDPKKSSVVDCFWHSLNFFEHCGCIYYQELIAHWILEGYFEPVRSVTKAYKDGHAIMMELIRRGFLKIQEGDVVMPEAAMKNLIDLRRRGLSGRSRVGLAKVRGSDMTKGLGKINQVDDIIEAVLATRKGEKSTTILVSGNRLRRENPKRFFEKLEDLEVLGLFEPKLDSFVSFLSKLVKLRILVIRECDLLNSIEELRPLQGLHVLEVSGSSCLKFISDDFFSGMSKLQSLHLSGLQISSSPSSISGLMELHRLIIRDCPLLVDLPNIQELVKLEVVDVSGASGLQTCFDNTIGEKKNKSKNKNFYNLTKLQLLDFSGTQIERLPMFQLSVIAGKLHSLTRLLLRNCSKLKKLPSLKPLSGLQILDLSGTTSLVKILEVCFEDKKELRVLNLRGSSIRQLPSTIETLSNLNELLLKDCTNLEVLPNIQKLTNLEVIDASGCTKLHTIEGSFVDMSLLLEINFNGTKVMIPPELPKESKNSCIKRIILADSRVMISENWSDMPTMMTDTPSSFDADVISHELSETKSGEISEIQSNESPVMDSGRLISYERDPQVSCNTPLHKTILSFFYSVSQQEAMEINEINDPGGFIYQDKEALANAEFVSFAGIKSTRLTSIFNEIKSVKGCWLRMYMDIKFLFDGVNEENLRSLETLSITNLPFLEVIRCAGSFKNLKNLSIDCCPKIKILFPKASQMPSSLEVLHVKFCEKLEKVFKEGEMSTLTTLCLIELPELIYIGAKLPNLDTFVKENCPKLLAVREDLRTSDWVVVDVQD